MTHCCCKRKQVTCFKLLTQATIERIRSTVFSLSKTEQTQLILNYMREHSRSQGDQGVLYTVGAQQVCEMCFRMVYGFRYNRFATVKVKFQSGVVVAEHGRLGRCIPASGLQVGCVHLVTRLGIECQLLQQFICLLASLKLMSTP